MSEDFVVRTTVDFIRSSSKNLDLALQVEEAMPWLRADLIAEFLECVEAIICTDGWQSHKTDTGMLKAGAWLAWREVDWPTDDDPADKTGILLSTDKSNWTQVYVGVYFSKVTRKRVRENEQEILQALREAAGRLPTGKGWHKHEFSQESLGGWNGWATYRYFNEPIYDWSGARFLKNSLDADRKAEMVEHVASRIESLKVGASALVEAVRRVT